jgi:hypothetical protein
MTHQAALLNLLQASLDLHHAQADLDFIRREREDLQAFRERIEQREASHIEFSAFAPEGRV